MLNVVRIMKIVSISMMWQIQVAGKDNLKVVVRLDYINNLDFIDVANVSDIKADVQ